jgi:hypothetical protein
MEHKILSLCLMEALLVHADMPINFFQRRSTSPPEACSLVPSAIGFCESASPGSTDFSPASQAPCLCYSFQGTNTAWAPDYFDCGVLTCANYIKTAGPTDYSVYYTLEGFCMGVGNILQSPIAATAKKTGATTIGTGSITPAAATTGLSACTTITDIIASCMEVTPPFRNLDNVAQASCACYSAGIWDPNGFDILATSCAISAKTDVPAENSVISPLIGFCRKYGRDWNSQTPATTSASKTTIVINTPATISVSQTTVSVKPSAGSTLTGGGFGKLVLALAAVALDVVLLF